MGTLSEMRTPVFRAGGEPTIADDQWRLTVEGLCQAPAEYTLAQVLAWPGSDVDARLTSVSLFSVRALWQGVLWRDFLPLARPLPQADHVAFVSHGGGYSTTVRLADLDHPRVLICWAVDGEPLERAYGGPLRMMIPNLWGYKSAKWLERIVFTDAMTGGYWEDRGYPRQADITPCTVLDVNSGQRRAIPGGEVTEF